MEFGDRKVPVSYQVFWLCWKTYLRGGLLRAVGGEGELPLGRAAGRARGAGG